MSFTEFLFRSTIVFAVLYLPYQLWFRRQTFFRLRRFYLLAAGGASLLLPLLPAVGDAQFFYGETLPVFVKRALTDETAAGGFPGWPPVTAVYVSGLLVFSILLFYRLARLLQLILASQPGERGVRVLPAKSKAGAFSFFGYIFLPAGIDADTRPAVLRHERVHIRQKHTFDMLFYELLILLSWFNPLYRLARKQLSATHEFIADEQACGDDVVQYKQVLVAHVLGLPRPVLVQRFSEPGNLKQRLIMLTKNRTSPRARLAYLLTLPLLVLTLSLNSFTTGGNSGGGGSPEKMPEFKGGQEALVKYLGDNIVYPEDAKTAKTSGTVFISFTIDKDGKVTDAKVAKPVSPSLDAEALRVIKGMPDWIPGEKDGKKVSVTLTLPVKFALN